MSSYFPLDRDILNSSLWISGDSHMKALWIYLLLSADPRTGVVSHTRPAIVHGSGVPRADVDRILEQLAAPDPDSRTPDNDGRRIAFVEEGILILNYERYRNKDYSTPRVRRYYERNPGQKHRKTGGGTGGNEGERSGTTNKNKNKNKEIDNDDSPSASECFPARDLTERALVLCGTQKASDRDHLLTLFQQLENEFGTDRSVQLYKAAINRCEERFDRRPPRNRIAYLVGSLQSVPDAESGTPTTYTEDDFSEEIPI